MTNQAIPDQQDELDSSVELKSYRVHLTGSQSVDIVVKVADLDLAVDIAYDEHIPDICAQCSGWGES